MFIRGFRVARTFRILPKHLKAAGSPPPDSDGYDSEPDVEAVSIAATPKVRNTKDPIWLFSIFLLEAYRCFQVSGSSSHITGLYR